MTQIKTSIPFIKIDVDTEIEIVLTKIFIKSKPVIIGNIYLPPDLSNIYVKHQLEKIILELDTPFILTFDANAHHYSWGSTVENTDARGNFLYDFIDNNLLVLLNTGDPTYLTNNGNYTHIDISVCSSELASSLNWQPSHDPMNTE